MEIGEEKINDAFKENVKQGAYEKACDKLKKDLECEKNENMRYIKLLKNAQRNAVKTRVHPALIVVLVFVVMAAVTYYLVTNFWTPEYIMTAGAML